MNKLPAIEYSSLLQQPPKRLQDVYSAAEELLAYSDMLPAELHIKLDTFLTDVATALEDKQAATDKESGAGVSALRCLDES